MDTIKQLDFTDEEIKDWMDKVDSLAASKDKTDNKNANPEFACIVLAKIYKESTHTSGGSTIYIYATNMDGTISHYDIYLNAMLRYIDNPNNQLKVLVDSVPKLSKGRNAFKVVKDLLKVDKYKDRVQLKIVRSSQREEVKKLAAEYLRESHQYVHFAVSSENAFRLEVNPISHEATYSFHNPEKCKTLIDLFTKLYKGEISQNISDLGITEVKLRHPQEAIE
ncbi:MAG: hypothetical protein AAF990_04150 [Bacteroidota bacterium]